MRVLFFVLSIVLTFIVNAQTKNPFSTLKFVKVIFYDFIQPGENDGLPLDDKGQPQQRILKQVQLDSLTIKKFNQKLGEKKSFGNVTASCFDPHCGMVYYLNNKPVAQLSICLACNRLRSTIEIPAQLQGKQGRGKDAYYIANGLSKSFRKFINGLLIKYSFSHHLEPGSYFDQ